MRQVVRVPAKINLVLDVGEARADGYHDVRTVLNAVAIFDRLTLVPAESISVDCDWPGIPADMENLAGRAAALLRDASGTRGGVRISIAKAIPPAAGLGGGSADAAAVLVGCNHLWGIGWDLDRLADLGRRLGSDVPFFLRGGTAVATGRGDVLEPLAPLPPLEVLLVQPPCGSSTASAYALLDASAHRARFDVSVAVQSLERLSRQPPASWSHALVPVCANSFEAVLFAERPDLVGLHRLLHREGAVVACVAGSGSALWAIGALPGWATALVPTLRWRGYWAEATMLYSGGVQRLDAREDDT